MTISGAPPTRRGGQRRATNGQLPLPEAAGRLLYPVRRMMMTYTTEHTERLWTSSDGTVCLLATSGAPPMYAVTLVRNERVLRECRLYGDASARMVAQSWESMLTGR